MNLDHQDLVARINGEVRQRRQPVPHPLGVTIGAFLFWFYVVLAVTTVAFVGGYLTGMEVMK